MTPVGCQLARSLYYISTHAGGLQGAPALVDRSCQPERQRQFVSLPQPALPLAECRSSALTRHYTFTIITGDTILHEQLCERTTNLLTTCDIH